MSKKYDAFVISPLTNPSLNHNAFVAKKPVPHVSTAVNQKRPGRPLVRKESADLHGVPKRPRTSGQSGYLDAITSSQNSIWDRSWPLSISNSPAEISFGGILPYGTALHFSPGGGADDASLDYGLNQMDFSPLSNEVSAIKSTALPPHVTEAASKSDTIVSEMTRSDSSSAEMPFDSTESLMKQLADMNLQIFRHTRTVAELPPILLTTSIPCIKSIFDAASELIRVMDNNKPRGSGQTSNTPESSADPNADCVDTFPTTGDLEIGLRFLVLACHQRLLSAFGRICLSIHGSLQGAVPDESRARNLMNSTSNTCPGIPGQVSCEIGDGAMTSPMTQYVMLAALMDHFVGRLDRALKSLVHDLPAPELESGRPVDRVSEESIRSLNADTLSTSCPSAPAKKIRGPLYSIEFGETETSAEGISENVNENYRVAVRIAYAMQMSHNHLQQRLEEVKTLVKSCDIS
ncbi:hypothetical protein F5B21DRAFT_508616 [Xylaria acuta]|nr:hypothetical protein F5B21DRAFT_508616 [Xylaria acuta]